jgi:hypothetical protein
MPPPRFLRFIFFVCITGLAATQAGAANQVALTSVAKEGYAETRKDGDTLRPETFVFMQGRHFSGITRDRSIEKMPFRRIAEYLVPQLAKQNYVPAKELAKSDLLLVVHWGTTIPHVSNTTLLARETTSEPLSESFDAMAHNNLVASMGDEGAAAMVSSYNPEGDIIRSQEFERISEQSQSDYRGASNAKLLGYTRTLAKMGKNFHVSTSEDTLRGDLNSEHYFLIVKAYDLREKTTQKKNRRPIWTLHVNIRSPGNNFEAALSKMSQASADYFGITTNDVETIKPRIRGGKVIIPPFKVIGEVE